MLTWWVIYDRPKDHPEHFVVRRWRQQPPHPAVPDLGCVLCDTIAAARATVPAPAVMVGPDAADDPCILEVWMGV